MMQAGNDVRFEAHSGLKPDIAVCPKSAKRRHRMLGLEWKWRQPRSAAISPYSMAVAPDFISQESPDGLYRTNMVLKT
jgi:hypothetical protein